MNRTIKEATVKRYYYQSHDHLKQHLHTFLVAYNFAKRLKTLKGLTCRLSPGRVGIGHSSSPPAPTIPPASGKPLSTRRRMVIAAVCQPLAAKPDSRVFLAASLSRWKG